MTCVHCGELHSVMICFLRDPFWPISGRFRKDTGLTVSVGISPENNNSSSVLMCCSNRPCSWTSLICKWFCCFSVYVILILLAFELLLSTQFSSLSTNCSIEIIGKMCSSNLTSSFLLLFRISNRPVTSAPVEFLFGWKHYLYILYSLYPGYV